MNKKHKIYNQERALLYSDVGVGCKPATKEGLKNFMYLCSCKKSIEL
jgi:hypothetical protein